MKLETDSDSVRLGGLLSGVLLTQIVNSAVHLAQPLLVADLSGSLGSAAFFAAFGTGIHMLGTFLAGWPTDRWGARLVLVFSTFCAVSSWPEFRSSWSSGSPPCPS